MSGFRSISLPSSGCFSPFPHGTGSLSVAEEYLGLEGGPPTFRQNCTSVDVLSSRYLDVSVPWVRLKPPILFGSFIPSLDNRKSKTSRLGDRVFLFEHQGTRPWSSGYRRWVSPFGNPWIKASSQLPTAYRSVARPSSPLSAKASTEHPLGTEIPRRAPSMNAIAAAGH